MSKRRNSTFSTRASCRASSVLPTPVGPGEQEVAHRLVGGAQARSRQLDRRRDFVDRRVLPEDHRLQLGVEVLERDLVVARHRLHRHPRHLARRSCSMSATPIDRRVALLRPARSFCAAPASSMHVDRLVGQMQILQVPRRQRRPRPRAPRPGTSRRDALRSARCRPLRISIVSASRRLEHFDLLEAARQRAILVERLLHVGERRRADAAQRARRQRRLQQVAGVHRPARRRAGADERVDLVDEEDRVLLLARARSSTCLTRSSKSPR